MQFIGIANYYNYFGDFVVPYDQGFVQEDDMLQAVQYQMLAPIYTAYVIRAFFEESTKLNFFNLACSLHTFKEYTAACADKTKINCLVLADFTGAIFPKLPARVQAVITATKVPEYQAIEDASVILFHVKPLDFDKFVTGSFLQKKASLKHKVMKTQLKSPIDVYAASALIVFPEPMTLIYQLISNFMTLDTFDVGPIPLADYIEF